MLPKAQTLQEMSRLLAAAVEAASDAAENRDVELFKPLRGRAETAMTKGAWPTGKEESWRYTQAAPLGLKDLGFAPRADCSWARLVAAFPEGALEGPRLVFINGHYAPEHSELGEVLGDTTTVTTLGQATESQTATWAPYLGKLESADEPNFAALNSSLVKDGVVIHVAPKVSLGAPVRLVFFNTEEAARKMSSPRVLVILEELAEASFIELYASASDDVMWSNGVTECHVGDGAHLEHAVLQKSGAGSLWMNHTSVAVGAHASFASDYLSMGGAWSRRELTVRLAGKAAHTRLTGLTLGALDEHSDQQVRVEHIGEHTTSHQHFRSLLEDRSVTVFGGMVYVAPGAQKTDAKQMSRNLILSGQARAHAKPGLEILADDVKCAHGATVSQLDKEALFYLRSRGISDAEARGLLVMAFGQALLKETGKLACRLFQSASANRMGGERFMENVIG